MSRLSSATMLAVGWLPQLLQDSVKGLWPIGDIQALLGLLVRVELHRVSPRTSLGGWAVNFVQDPERSYKWVQCFPCTLIIPGLDPQAP